MNGGNNDEKQPKVFRPTSYFVKELGLNPAVILEELTYRQLSLNAMKPAEQRKYLHGGKLWFFSPTVSIYKNKNSGAYPPFAIKFPWLSPSTISKILVDLKKLKLIKIANLNFSPKNQIKHFHVPAEVVQRVKAGYKLQISLDSVVAYGPTAALLLNQAQYRLGIARDDIWLKLSPDELIYKLPLSESAIRRGLKTLVDAGELIKDGFAPFYRLAKENPLDDKICGRATRRFIYTDESDAPELNQLALEIAREFTNETYKELWDIKQSENHLFNKAAEICFKHDISPGAYVAGVFQVQDPRRWPKPWMPELLVRDDAEELALAVVEGLVF